MRTKEGEELARRVVRVYEHFGRARQKTVQHFAVEGAVPSTIYKILARYNSSGQVGYGKNRGAPPHVRTPQAVAKIKSLCKKYPDVTYTELSALAGISETATKRICSDHELGFAKRKPAPTRTRGQPGRLKLLILKMRARQAKQREKSKLASKRRVSVKKK